MRGHALRSVRGRLACERGYTLVELLTAATLTILLMATFGTLLVTSGRQQPQIADRSAQVQQGRAAVERITRELREGYQVVGTPTASQISVNTFVRTTDCGDGEPLASDEPATACRVTFSCTSSYCTRTEAETNGSGTGTAVRLVGSLRNGDVFSYWPSSASPSHVSVTLSYPNPDGSESITVSDGTELRNDA